MPQDCNKVSVIIPSYNYGSYVGDAVESALNQTFSPSEIIVVDDGSIDETPIVVKKFSDARVKYFWQENAGVSTARNRGISESSGDLIAFLDADDVWDPHKLEKQVEALRADTKLGLVHCGMLEVDIDTGETIKKHPEGMEGWIAHEIALWESRTIGSPSTVVVPRKVIEEVGGFDPQLTHGEDWEFFLRVARRFKIGFVPDSLVLYRTHTKNASMNVPIMEQSTLLAWRKAFSVDDETITPLRRRSYGNLHKVLAGSYLHYGDYKGFARNVLKSLWYRPSYIGYYLRLLFRGRKN